MGPGETVGEELQDNQGIDGIVFTGSYEVGLRAVQVVLDALAAAVHRRDGRQEPGDRVAQGRPRGGRRGDHAQRVRLRRAEVLGELAASTSSGRSTTSSSACSSRRPRSSPSATRSTAQNWLGPVIDQKAVDRHQQAVSEARRDGTVFTGGERLTDGDLARGFYVEPTVVGNLPADHRLFQDELFAPFTAVHAVDSLDEALALANDSIYGLTAGVYSEDPAEVAALPRRDRRRASCTSTGAPARPPAPGRASRRSAAGRARGSTGKAGLVAVLRRPVPARAEPHVVD